MYRYLLLFVFFSSPVLAQDNKPTVLHTEIDAVGWAFDALQKYPEEDQQFIRFVYLPPWADPDWIGAVDFAVNTAASHSRNLIRGDRHAGGWLLAYNLRALAPDPHELKLLIQTWDNLALKESKFHVPAVNIQDVVTVVEVEERDRFGRLQKVKKNEVRKVSQKTAFLAPHLQEALAVHISDSTKSVRVDILVTQLTKSTGGIYPADFLIEQLLTSLRGNYVEFRQIDLNPGAGKVPLQEHLKKRGFYFDAAVAAGGEKGSVQLISDVTGKSRLVLTVFGLSNRTPMMITFDFKDSNTRPDAQFIRNILEFDRHVDASETFVPLPNGFIEYILADGRGNIQKSAPPDVVADSTKPNGHTKELEMGMSCVVCHAPHDGYQPVRNDLELLLGSDIDFFGDQVITVTRSGVQKVFSKQEARDIIAGRYAEPLDEPDGILGRARRDYSKSVALLVDYPINAENPSVVKFVGEKVKQIYHQYRYSRITADRACLELGVRVPQGTGKQYLKLLVPPPPPGEIEDVMIALLRNGAEIKRDDMDSIFPEMARRAVETRKALKENN